MKIFKVGVLGFAKIFSSQVGRAITDHPRFELAVVASKSGSKELIQKSFKCKVVEGYSEVLDNFEVDVVYIPLPNGLHEEWVSKALEAGKGVLCEKSLGCNLAEVERMTQLARTKNLLLVENFQFRFHSQHQYVKSILKEDALGQIHSFRSSFGFPPFPDMDNIRYNKDLGGGALLDAGAYTLKAMQFIMGQGFQIMGSTINQSANHEVDITGSVYAKNEDGVDAHLTYGFNNQYQCCYELWGSKGKLTCTRAFTAKPDHVPELIIENTQGRNIVKLDPDDHFTNMLTHLSNCLDKGDSEEENIQNLSQARLIEEVKIKSHE